MFPVPSEMTACFTLLGTWFNPTRTFLSSVSHFNFPSTLKFPSCIERRESMDFDMRPLYANGRTSVYSICFLY